MTDGSTTTGEIERELDDTRSRLDATIDALQQKLAPGSMVEEAVNVGDLVRLMTLRQGQANLVEVTLPEATPLAGRRVRDLKLPADAALVSILRGGRVIVPQADDPLEVGDELLFVVPEDREDELERMLAPTEHGGGKG